MPSPMSGDDTIDRVLRYCQLHNLHTVTDSDLPKECRRHADGAKSVRIDSIVFRCSGHDTGNDVRGWIIDGDDAYEFVSTTYWFSSHYTFNESRWERGAWDAAVDSFFATLRDAKAAHESAALLAQTNAAEKRKQAAAEVKAKFERQFA